MDDAEVEIIMDAITTCLTEGIAEAFRKHPERFTLVRRNERFMPHARIFTLGAERTEYITADYEKRWLEMTKPIKYRPMTERTRRPNLGP